MLKKREGSREKERPNMRQNDSMQKAIAMCLQELGRVFEDRILEHHSFRESPRVEANSHFLYPISKKNQFILPGLEGLKLNSVSCLVYLSCHYLPNSTPTHTTHTDTYIFCVYSSRRVSKSVFTLEVLYLRAVDCCQKVKLNYMFSDCQRTGNVDRRKFSSIDTNAMHQ